DKATRHDATPAAAVATASAAPAALPAAELAGGKVAADELTELFFAASADERRLILFNLPYAALPPAEPIAPHAAAEAVRRLEAGLRMLAIWRAGHKAEPRIAAHEPQYWHVDSGERAPPVARPKVRWDEHAAHKTEAG